MDFETAMVLALPAGFFSMMALEPLVGSERKMAAVRGWRLIGVAALTVTLACNALMPLAIMPHMPAIRVVDLSSWQLWAAVPAVVLTTFLTYWSHRIQHRFDFLWRLGHQLHHGVVRVDIASAMIFHPVDIFFQVLMTLIAAMLLGISPEAAALSGTLGFFIALYQHWNVATPAWTGWLIQRPEAHMLHHERDVHARNFGDMPIWDRLFGTYAAPGRGCESVPLGFEPEASRRWLAMIACVDVNRRTGRKRL